MKLYLFEPYDVLSFGGLKNFSAGESHIQKSSFPPPIMRFFPYFKKVYSVLLVKGKEVFLPVPADCLTPRKGEKGDLVIAPLEFPPVLEEEKPYEPAEGFVSLGDFVEKYAKGKGGFILKKLSNFLETETRVGVKLSVSSRTSKESMLYSQDFLRFKEDTFLGVLASEPDRLKPFNKIGGEGRPTRLRGKWDLPDFFKEEQTVKRGAKYKFYLLSHAFVKEGIKEGANIKIGGREFRVLWLHSKGSEFISGFRKPFLEMLRPASVLILEALEDGTVKRVCQIDSYPEVISEKEKFLERGWNSGIILEVKG